MDAYTRMALLCTRHIYVHADEDNVQRIYYDGKKNLSSNELSVFTALLSSWLKLKLLYVC
jgi:hypothetical protein